MGVASRTKWERRARWPLDKVEHIDTAKLAHACKLLFRRLRREEAVEAAKPREQGWLDDLAREKRLAINRRQNRCMRGWLPRAQR